MSSGDGPFSDGPAGPAGPVRVADFDALDDPDEAGPAVRVASFDLDDTGSPVDDASDGGGSSDIADTSAVGEPAALRDPTDDGGNSGDGNSGDGAPTSGFRTVELDGVPDAEAAPRTRVVSFDDAPDDTGSGGTVRQVDFGGPRSADRRRSRGRSERRDDVGGGRSDGESRPRRGRGGRRDEVSGADHGSTFGSGVGDTAGGADHGGTRKRPAFGRPVSDVVHLDGATSDEAGPDEGSARDRRRSRGGRGGRGANRADAGPPPDDETRAKEICLRLLTDRARTVKELRDALVRKEIPEDVADRVLERFDEVGLVDDEAFAGQWVRSRHRHRGLGRRAIAQELRRKGVAKDIADEALTEIDAESEEARARELVDKKIRTVTVGTREERASASRRLVGMLARKGYGAGVAYTVVREAIAARGAEEDEFGEEPPED